MKAIVLTYDRNHPITDLMIGSYEREWPNHPFTFHVPYQQFLTDRLAKKYPGLVFVHTDSGFKDTIQALLQGLDNEEWIYWCPDEFYPVDFNAEVQQEIHDWIISMNGGVDGVLLLRPKKLNSTKLVDDRDMIQDLQGRIYARRKTYQQVFVHQYMRVKVLQEFFKHVPDDLKNTRFIDENKRNWGIPKGHKLYVIKNNLVRFGESLRQGKLTSNGVKRFIELGISIPGGFGFHNETIFRDAKR